MPGTENLKIEYVAVDSLAPYEKNARSHGKEDLKAIEDSIREFGFVDPIGVWHDIIVEGHGRLLAAKQIGMTEVPVIRLDQLTDEQRRAYALAHNKTAELSGWDFNVLASELQDIAEIDMSKFGFDMSALGEDKGSRPKKRIRASSTILKKSRSTMVSHIRGTKAGSRILSSAFFRGAKDW